MSQVQVGFPGQVQPSYAPQPQLGGEWGAASGAMGAQPTLGFPQAAPQAAPQPPPQPGAEWAQAAQFTMATGQLPPGVTPEMIQESMLAEQQIMQQHLETQQNVAMQGHYEQAQQSMQLSGMMEGNLENAAKGISSMASSIGDMNVGGDKDTKSTDTSTDTSTTSTPAPAPTTTGGADTAVNMNDLSPTNLQNTMDMHMQHMQMPESPMTSFGGMQQGAMDMSAMGGAMPPMTGMPQGGMDMSAMGGAMPPMTGMPQGTMDMSAMGGAMPPMGGDMSAMTGMPQGTMDMSAMGGGMAPMVPAY